MSHRDIYPYLAKRWTPRFFPLRPRSARVGGGIWGWGLPAKSATSAHFAKKFSVSKQQLSQLDCIR